MHTDAHRWGKTNTAYFLIYLCVSVCICGSNLLAEEPKPKVAVFPLAGSAKAETREKIGFSLRAKIDREGTYEVIDGPTMLEIAGEQKFDATAKLADVEKLAKDADAEVLIWGEAIGDLPNLTLRLKLFDRRQLDPLPHQFEKQITEPTDLRFVSESIIEQLEGVKAFEHPTEQPVQRDAIAEKLWQENPNLVVNGTFDQAANWAGIYLADKYTVKFTDAVPDVDKIAIYRMPAEGGNPYHVLAMNLSRQAAENNGLACLSDSIKIEPNTRYRLSFRYKSEAPTLHVFVKGYTMAKNLKGEMVEREIYRRQVPPSGGTNGEWVTVVDELNPQHTTFPVQYLKVDLYAYLSPGVVMFDDVVLKAVGAQNRVAKDKAIKAPVTRPAAAD